ncbi:1-phosphofructokinase family hexose kinase [Microbacterium sp.]|uniref:1-phosphofructokinase family hexose kinase n=1 Tax=Microbacterium sp. TaxID=51671 RepID=UPI003A8405B8
MIVTLTVHPSLDRTVGIELPLRVGDVQAGTSLREDAGGKGVNVSAVIARADQHTLAVLPLAGEDPLASLVAATGVPARIVPVLGRARSNLAIVDPGGTTTKINLPGAHLADAELDAVIEATVASSAGADWLVLAGSLPPGAPDDLYVRVIDAVRRASEDDAPRIAVDTSGPALHAVVASGRPDLIKPNEEELAELVGVALDPERDLSAAVARIARDLVPVRVHTALVTLGAKGAVLISPEGAWTALPPPMVVRSTVGAGDSSLAGYLLADLAGDAAPDRLRSATRYGAAAAALPGTQHPGPDDLPRGDIAVQAITP